MSEAPNNFQLIAEQLRQPRGEAGKMVGEKMNDGNKLINEWTIAQLKVAPNDRILEIGMGNGFFVRDILSVDPSVFYCGCDFSELMVVESINSNLEFTDNGQAQFILSDAANLPLENESFNKAFSINTIYFWMEPQRQLSEIYRVLKPGGILIVSIRPKSSMAEYPFTAYGFNLFSKEDLVLLLSNNRFRVEEGIETSEPDQEVNGNIIKVDSLIVRAVKT